LKVEFHALLKIGIIDDDSEKISQKSSSKRAGAVTSPCEIKLVLLGA